MDKKKLQARDASRTFLDPVQTDPVVSSLMVLEYELLKIVNEIAAIRRERADAILKAYRAETSGRGRGSDSVT